MNYNKSTEMTDEEDKDDNEDELIDSLNPLTKKLIINGKENFKINQVNNKELYFSLKTAQNLNH